MGIVFVLAAALLVPRHHNGVQLAQVSAPGVPSVGIMPPIIYPPSTAAAPSSQFFFPTGDDLILFAATQ